MQTATLNVHDLACFVRIGAKPGLLLAMAAAIVLLMADSNSAQAQDQDAPPKSVVQLPWHMYRHYPADFSRWHEAAVGFKGWDQEVRELDLDRTCLVLMHFPQTGLTPGTEWGPDCPQPNSLGTIEWVPRTMDVVTFRMPRLVKAAREAGLLIAHVWGGPGTGPVWEQSLKEAGDPPASDPDVLASGGKYKAQHSRDVFDLPRSNTPAQTYETPDLGSRTKTSILDPQEGDVCAAYSWQLHRLLSNRGVDHIVYCGWALNWCLWFSPGGMCDMDRKGYLCSAVRGGCVAIENRESAVGEQNLEYALWKTSTMFGYVFDLHELTTALREYAATQKPPE